MEKIWISLLAKQPLVKNYLNGELAASVTILLRHGYPGKPVQFLAKECLQQHGSLTGLLNLPLVDFCQIKGLSEIKYAELHSAFELGNRIQENALQEQSVLDSPRSLQQFLQRKLGSLDQELFACLLLDKQFKLKKFTILFKGTIDRVIIHPRIFLKQLIDHGATAVILAHNHPSGKLNPSQEDKLITEHLQQICELIEVQLLDHLIIGNGHYYSFAENGLLN